jgi:hypothetical protein
LANDSVARGTRKRQVDRRRKTLEYKAKLKVRQRRWHLKVSFGLTLEQFEQMLTRQQGRCAICKEPFKHTPCVDHCHATSRVRELLCMACNRGIGYLRDSADICKSAARYLDRHARE